MKESAVSLLIKKSKVEGRSLHGEDNQDSVTYVWSSTKKWDTVLKRTGLHIAAETISENPKSFTPHAMNFTSLQFIKNIH